MTVLKDYASTLTQPALGEALVYDEVVGPDGALRPAWKPMAEIAVTLTEGDMRRVGRDVNRFLADDGVTYARPGQGPERWRLDPIPLVIDAAQWAPLEVGLAQRGELLNAILVDLYGPQRLLSEGIVPPALVFGHAGFNRAVARPEVGDPRPLVLAATDLGRDAQGVWRVLADRAQAPSGIGYAMENRRVISRVLPELYREAGLHRMEPYFWALRSALIQSAPGHLADPRVVVLSPGTHSETAYDQAFVASALGFPLVQGNDLTVSDGWLYLKVPGGMLERVDVVLRRVDANWSDPLELRGDSQLGVAGLVEAARRGRVRVVNGFGAGVLENPGLLPYLPAACEALLGEQLRLEAVPTWWCGDEAQRAHVLANLDHLAVRAIDGPTNELSDVSRDAVRARITAEPHRFVGQELLPLSQAPTWDGVKTRGCRVTLRGFTLRYGSAYRPLVGGLATVIDGYVGVGGASKDVWVLKEAPGDPDQSLTNIVPMTNQRGSTMLVQRAMEDMFWVGRYAERAEDLLRLVLAAHVIAEDFRTRPHSVGGTALDTLLTAMHRLAGPGGPDLDADFRSVLLDPVRDGSVAQSLSGVRQAMDGVRDQMSNDVWRSFASIERAALALRETPYSHQIAESAGRMLNAILALDGVTANMIRDAGWHMIRTGRTLERSLQLTRLLRVSTTQRQGLEVDRAVLTAVLQSSESSVTHRRRYRGFIRTSNVLDLLLLDPENPRSLAFNLRELQSSVAVLPSSTGSSRPERLLDDLIDMVEATDVAMLALVGGSGRPNLEAFLDATISHLERLADAVVAVHLASGPVPRLQPSLVR